MATILSIITGENNTILRTKSQRVPKVTKPLKKFIEKMHATVRRAKGIGLAAPQVGENIRVLIAQISGTFLTMINPEILTFSEESEIAEEGCLSLPDRWGMVTRPRNITVQFLSEKSEYNILRLTGMDARVVQHEVDHLDGILFIDRIQEQQSIVQSPQDHSQGMNM